MGRLAAGGGAHPLALTSGAWPEFLAWAERTCRLARFVNPYEVIDWNSHKQYLRGLAEAGIATVPTLWLDHGCR